MPITIDGSGTVTGISAGGLPDGVITTDDIAANAVTTAKLGSGEASGLAKAWVNFNGTGTVAIRASYNVSSITDNGTGDYTVNFTTAMPDANYSVAHYVAVFNNNAITSFRGAAACNKAAGTFRFRSVYVSGTDGSGAAEDSIECNASFFR